MLKIANFAQFVLKFAVQFLPLFVPINLAPTCSSDLKSQGLVLGLVWVAPASNLPAVSGCWPGALKNGLKESLN